MVDTHWRFGQVGRVYWVMLDMCPADSDMIVSDPTVWPKEEVTTV
jgi:hypothetical protein